VVGSALRLTCQVRVAGCKASYIGYSCDRGYLSRRSNPASFGRVGAGRLCSSSGCLTTKPPMIVRVSRLPPPNRACGFHRTRLSRGRHSSPGVTAGSVALSLSPGVAANIHAAPGWRLLGTPSPCRPSPCGRLSRPPSTMAAPTPPMFLSPAAGDIRFRVASRVHVDRLCGTL